MMLYFSILTFLVTLCWLFSGSEGRGRLVDPPARGSLWRYGFDTPKNYNDNGLNCGGVSVEWGVNGGKCGVCGDPYNGRRLHEAGGRYATGIIARKYQQGQVVRAVVEVTANELGWFEFHLCAHNNPAIAVREECLNQTVLELVSGGTRYHVPHRIDSVDGFLSVDLRLPADVTCSQCVFRWKWNAGNMWGWSSSGQSCLGCGHQEQFYGCADVAITAVAPLTSVERSTTPASTTTSLLSVSSRHCYAVNLWQGEATLDFWCRLNCLTYSYCPDIYCKCDD